MCRGPRRRAWRRVPLPLPSRAWLVAARAGSASSWASLCEAASGSLPRAHARLWRAWAVSSRARLVAAPARPPSGSRCVKPRAAPCRARTLGSGEPGLCYHRAIRAGAVTLVTLGLCQAMRGLAAARAPARPPRGPRCVKPRAAPRRRAWCRVPLPRRGRRLRVLAGPGRAVAARWAGDASSGVCHRVAARTPRALTYLRRRPHHASRLERKEVGVRRVRRVGLRRFATQARFHHRARHADVRDASESVACHGDHRGHAHPPTELADGEGPHLACGSRACQLPLLLGHRLCSDADFSCAVRAKYVQVFSRGRVFCS